MIGLSDALARQISAIALGLRGAGLNCSPIDPTQPPARDQIRILHISETAHATHRDIVVDLAEGPPTLVRRANGQPARVRFGSDDIAFGVALIAELARPAIRPACGEPDSAMYLALAQKVAVSEATVLVLGETGTGKEGLARYIHACSKRRDGPFVAVNCAALPETMLEAMLFGHQKGSFTGAGGASEGLFRAAEGGTLLLDEIAELPLALQAKLLRAIQEREVLPVGATKAIPVDVRIVAAANRDLAGEVAAGRFRADLYWRLNVLPLTLRPLAERPLDIAAIAATLMLRHTRADEIFPWPTPQALDRLMAHDWPGNVRELENILQRALLLRGGERIDVGDLSLEGAIPSARASASNVLAFNARSAQIARLADVSRHSEAQAIREALDATGGHRSRAAARLGISERTLRYRLADMRATVAA